VILESGDGKRSRHPAAEGASLIDEPTRSGRRQLGCRLVTRSATRRALPPPSIAELEPSPNKETHDAASPSNVTRPRDQDDMRILLMLSK
jgi:hypothetical protein